MKTALFIVGQIRSLILPEMQIKLKESLKHYQGDIFFVLEEQESKIDFNTFSPREIRYYKYDDKPPSHQGRPTYLMAYGWKECMELINKYEVINKKKYELIYKTRPDLLLLNYIPEELAIPREDLEDLIVYGETLGGCKTAKGTPNEAMKDTFNIITRPACEAFFRGFFESFYVDDFYSGHERQPNEAKLGLFLNENNVKKRLVIIKRLLIRMNYPRDRIKKSSIKGEVSIGKPI